MVVSRLILGERGVETATSGGIGWSQVAGGAAEVVWSRADVSMAGWIYADESIESKSSSGSSNPRELVLYGELSILSARVSLVLHECMLSNLCECSSMTDERCVRSQRNKS
jgi:hypothetical protein